MKIHTLFKHRSTQVILTLLIYSLTASILPVEIHRLFYTLGLLIKDCLIWMLPLTVAVFIASTVASFKKKAPLFVLVLFIFEACSNFSSVWYAYLWGNTAGYFLPHFSQVSFTSSFSPFWRIPFQQPAWWSAEKGALAGLILGVITVYSGQKSGWIQSKLIQGRMIAEWILTRVFTRLIPVYILGFAASIYQTGILGHLTAHYSILVLWLLAALACYLLFLFALGAGCRSSTLKRNLGNLAPAGMMALTSGCSLSTMPWTIAGTEKSLKNPELAKAVIPATTNIQQVGDCITNAFLCCLIYRSFHGSLPDLGTWITFSIVFTLARFSTAAVLGGAIFIMLPIYEHYLSFTPEMIAMILAFNVVLDSLVTSSNVMANGALCIVFEKVWQRATSSRLKVTAVLTTTPLKE